MDPVVLFGHNDRNLHALENSCGVSLVARGERLLVEGPEKSIREASGLLQTAIESLRRDPSLSEEEIQALLQRDLQGVSGQTSKTDGESLGGRGFRTYRTTVRARSGGQLAYLEALRRSDIIFVIGPAGTGKTYLAVAAAVSSLKQKKVSRIILARPAVEAGESLGFLPGALEEKVDPYLRPLYDALQELLESERLARLQSMKVVEVAPLAFMRGRTLNDSFVILDEAQNTTPAQMKMFLTRLGAGSKAVVTGDITQTDLPEGQVSGLVDVRSVLRDIDGLDFIHLTERDVMRNPLVQRIVQAYEHQGESRRTTTEARDRHGHGTQPVSST